MSTIDPASQTHLDTILKKLGVNQEEESQQKNADSLGQSDFLKLMTTQLQNQIRLLRWTIRRWLSRWHNFHR